MFLVVFNKMLGFVSLKVRKAIPTNNLHAIQDISSRFPSFLRYFSSFDGETMTRCVPALLGAPQAVLRQCPAPLGHEFAPPRKARYARQFLLPRSANGRGLADTANVTDRANGDTLFYLTCLMRLISQGGRGGLDRRKAYFEVRRFAASRASAMISSSPSTCPPRIRMRPSQMTVSMQELSAA